MNYHINRNGQNYGPYPLAKFDESCSNGEILEKDLIWIDGSPQWVSVAEYKQSKVPNRAQNGNPPPPPPPPSVYYQQSGPPKAQPLHIHGGLVLLTLLFPLIGLIVGIVKMTNQETRQVGVVLTIASFVLMVFGFIIVKYYM